MPTREEVNKRFKVGKTAKKIAIKRAIEKIGWTPEKVKKFNEMKFSSKVNKEKPAKTLTEIINEEQVKLLESIIKKMHKDSHIGTIIVNQCISIVQEKLKEVKTKK